MPTKPKRHAFRIPIGDWSGDGHSQVEWFEATASKPIDEIRDAYFAAKKKLPKLCPEAFCSNYEDSVVPDAVIKALQAAGCPLPEHITSDKEGFSEGLGAEGMAAVVVWFLNQGDPDLDARLDLTEAAPMLQFYGYDQRKRHIGHIGYGLFCG